MSEPQAPSSGVTSDVHAAGDKLVDGAQDLVHVAADLGRDEAKIAVEAVSRAMKSLSEALDVIKKAV